MVLAAIARGLGARIENTVLTRGYDGSPSFEDYEGLRVRRYPNPAPERWKDYATGAHHVSFPAKSCVALFDVAACARRLGSLAAHADLIHLHFPLPLGLSVLASRSAAPLPLVVTVHGNADVYEMPRALAPLTRAVLERAQAVVSVSHELAQYLTTRLGVSRVSVVANGVDTELYRPRRRSRSDKITLLSISRIVPRKNIDVLIAAVDALAREGETRLRLIIAGTGPAEREIERLARASGSTTTWLGFVDEARKRELLAEADVFVQLSIREGLSVATLEALASGLPCIVSDLPGVREPVTPGKTGFLVRNPESVEDVKWTLRRLLASWRKLDELGNTARRSAEERYSLKAMAEGYYRVYCDVLGRSAP